MHREMIEMIFLKLKPNGSISSLTKYDPSRHTPSSQTELPHLATSPRIPPSPTRASAGGPSPPELDLLRATGELAATGCAGARLRLRSERERLFLRTASLGSAMAGAARDRHGRGRTRTETTRPPRGGAAAKAGAEPRVPARQGKHVAGLLPVACPESGRPRCYWPAGARRQ